MISLARSLVALTGFATFFSLAIQSAHAQTWNQGSYQQPIQQNSQLPYGEQSQNPYGNQAQNQYNGQMQTQYGLAGQGQMQGQMPNQVPGQYNYQGQDQYGNSGQQMPQTYFGQAQQSQSNPYSNNTTGGFSQDQGAFNSQSQPVDLQNGQGSPGSFIDYNKSLDQAEAESGGVDTTVNSAPSGTKTDKLKGATGAIGGILAKSLKVAAPVAGAYMLNKAAQRNGYYQNSAYPYSANAYGAVNPYGGGYGAYGNPYYGNQYGSPYGGGYGTGYGYANPYNTMPNPYYPPQSTGNSILNTGLRTLFGY